MDSKILQLIESANPQDRKKAVKMLAQMGGQDALRYLGQIYKHDDDPEIKDLAIQAGKYIKKQEAAGVAPVASPAPAPVAPPKPTPVVEEVVEEVEEDELEEEFKPVVVSASSQTQAKGLMDRALDLSMHGEKDKAIESMAKAFKVNPNLRLDTFYMGVAMDITGLNDQATLRLVTSDAKSRKAKEKAKNKAKAKNDGSGGGDEAVTWDTALLDLGLYYIVIAGITIVGMVMIIQAITNGFAALSTSCTGCTPLEIQQMSYTVQNFRSVSGMGIVASILYGLVTALSSVIGLIMYMGMIHLVSTMLLNGEGTFPGLIYRASLPLIITYAISGVAGLVVVYLTIRNLFNPDMLLQISQGKDASADFGGLLVGAFCVISLTSLIGFIWFINRVAQSYEFSWLRGCFANIIANIALSAVATGCWTTVLNSILSSLIVKAPS